MVQVLEYHKDSRAVRCRVGRRGHYIQQPHDIVVAERGKQLDFPHSCLWKTFLAGVDQNLFYRYLML